MRAGKTLDRLPTMMLGQSLADVEARHVDEAYAMLLDTFVPLLLKVSACETAE